MSPGEARRLSLVLATANPDKAAEIGSILGGTIELVPRPGDVADVDEHADTVEGNARLKATALLAATGQASLADDTALEVDALDGAPGVRSARYAGDHGDAEANIAKLLEELDGIAAPARTARFRTVALACFPGGREVMAEGVIEGRIATAPAGEGGFGYDPVFLPREGSGRTFAEMSGAQKHVLSHRGRALRSLAEQLGSQQG